MDIVGKILSDPRIDPAFKSGVVNAAKFVPFGSGVALPNNQNKRPIRQRTIGTSLATNRGMKTVPKYFVGRGKVLKYLGDGRALFECPNGHQFRTKVMPDAPGGRKASEASARMMAEYWMRSGVRLAIRECPICRGKSQ